MLIWPFVYLLWGNIYSSLLPIFESIGFFLLLSCGSSLHILDSNPFSGILLAVLFHGLPFHFVDSVFWCTEVFKFNSSIFLFFLCCLCFCCTSRAWVIWGTSLVAQWLRIRLPMQRTPVRALVQEDPTCRGATKPVHHNYWACTPQLLKPACLEPVLRNKRSHRNEKSVHRSKE